MFINYLIGLFVFIFGLCIGSFLNCLIYRLEQNKKITGRSFCPHCQHVLSWHDLFPVFSFLFIGGKCQYCKKNISWQYPLVEIATGILFVLIFWKLGFIFVLGSELWDLIRLCFIFYIASSLIVIFIYDLKHYIIPDKVLFPAIAVCFIWDLVGHWALDFGFLNYILATLISAGFFLLIFLISGGRWMGFGDVKLAVLMGLLLGVPNVLVALFLAFFLGAIIGVILMAFPFGSGKQRKGLKSEIPFGPFLIAGTFIALFWGQQIISWYVNFLLI